MCGIRWTSKRSSFRVKKCYCNNIIVEKNSGQASNYMYAQLNTVTKVFSMVCQLLDVYCTYTCIHVVIIHLHTHIKCSQNQRDPWVLWVGGLPSLPPGLQHPQAQHSAMMATSPTCHKTENKEPWQSLEFQLICLHLGIKHKHQGTAFCAMSSQTSYGCQEASPQLF